LAAVEAACRAGCAGVKLKVSPATAAAVTAAVRAAHPGLLLAADANGSFAGADPTALAWADEAGLAYLEQPLAPDDLVGHAELAAALVTPVALDESLATPGLVRAAIALGALDVANVKPARLGGLAAAVAALDACVSAGVDAFVGGMLELGVGRATAAAVAALDGCTLPTDLGPSAQYVAADVAGPVEVDAAGRLVVPAGPGTGVEVDRERLAAVAEEVL